MTVLTTRPCSVNASFTSSGIQKACACSIWSPSVRRTNNDRLLLRHDWCRRSETLCVLQCHLKAIDKAEYEQGYSVTYLCHWSFIGGSAPQFLRRRRFEIHGLLRRRILGFLRRRLFIWTSGRLLSFCLLRTFRFNPSVMRVAVTLTRC